MQEFDTKKNRFRIIHYKSSINDNVSKAFLDLNKGELEIFYDGLDDYNIKPEETMVFQVFNEDETVDKVYLLNKLKMLKHNPNYMKYKIDYIAIYYTLDDEL